MERMPPAATDLDYVRGLFLFWEGIGLRPTELQQLTRALPEVAEEIRCGQLAVPSSAKEDLLQHLWKHALPRLDRKPSTGWPGFAGACLLAAEVLGVELEGAEEEPAFTLWKDAQRQRGARVHALVAGGAPVRIYRALVSSGASGTPKSPEVATCGALARELLGAEGELAWSTEPEVQGPSKMAAFLLREVVARWPEAFEGVQDIGITGALDERGLAVAVSDVPDKVVRFFREFSEGLCFVPAANWDETLAALTKSGTFWRYEFLHPFRSVTELLVRFGIVTPRGAATHLFHVIRERSRSVTDWRQRKHPPDQLLRLRISAAKEQEERYRSLRYGTDKMREVVRLLLQDEHLRRSGPARATLQGDAGSGKSMLLRQLHHDLSEGRVRWDGPSVRIDGRHFQRGASVASLVARVLGAPWSEEAVAGVLLSPELAGGIWLLVDGIDEVKDEEREDMLEAISEWPGPAVLTSRPLRTGLPGQLRLYVDPLDSSQIEELLRFEGREDLLAGIPSSSWDQESDAEPVRGLLRDICRTPLGTSLVAELVEPGQLKGLTRQRLLSQGMKKLVLRALSERRVKDTDTRLFELRGEQLIGGLAWKMLKSGRAEVHNEDFAGLAQGLLEPVSRLLEQGGFAQWVGPGRWAFHHKSFAEHCAAQFLMALEFEAGVDELFAEQRLGRPGVDEVLLHFAGALPAERAGVLVRRLLQHERLPLSALALATRVLLVLEHVEPALAMAVLARRLRLLTALPRQQLPGGVHRDAALWRALERLVQAKVLGPEEVRALVSACHEDAQRWLQGKGEEEASERTRARRDLAMQFVRTTGLDVPLEAILRFQDGGKLLAQRCGRGAWAAESLLPFLHHPDDLVLANARQAWVRCAPLEVLFDQLEFASEWPAEINGMLLDLLRKHGSEQQKKEGLLRIVLGRAECPRTDFEGDPISPVLLQGRIRDIPSQRLLELWEWAWRTGVLGGEDRRTDLPLERLYARYLRDSCGPARWRALVAWRTLAKDAAQDKAQNKAQNKARRAAPLSEVKVLLLEESLPEVRIEAMELLREAAEPVPLLHLMRSLAAADDTERWVAWRFAVETGASPSLEQFVNVLVPLNPKEREPAHGAPRWRWEAAEHGRDASRVLVRHAQDLCRSLADLELIFALHAHEPWTATIEQIFGNNSFFRPPLSLLSSLLLSEPAERRLWAAQKLRDEGSEKALELLAGAVSDPDPEVAALARKAVELRKPRVVFTRPSRVRRVPVRPRDETSVAGFDLKGPLREKEGVAIAEAFETRDLERFKSFEEIWAELRAHPLELKQAQDMVAAYDDEAMDFLGELAAQASAENLALLRPVLTRLKALYRPELLPDLIKALGDPYIGYLASYLLQIITPGKALLDAFQHGEASAVRAARAARNSPFAEAATGAFISALTAEAWPVPVAESRYNSPRWVSALAELGGLEGLVRLLEAGPREHVRREVLAHIDRERDELTARLAKSLRQRIAAWARGEALRGLEEESRVTALHLLTLVGEREDARQWEEELRRGPLTVPLTVAALGLIARRGTSEQLPLLEELIRRPEPEVVSAAVQAMGNLADPARLLELLREPPEVFRDERRLYGPGGYTWARGRLSAARGVVERGDRAHARELARLMRYDRDVWQLARDHARLAEHALLVSGYVLSDPGDSVMPASVTGGGDEVISSDVPDNAARIVRALVEKCGRDEVRDALVEALLWPSSGRDGVQSGLPPALSWDEDSYSRQFFDDELKRLGGPRSAVVPRLLEHLREEPDSAPALELLARTGVGEELLTRLWQELRVPWWTAG